MIQCIIQIVTLPEYRFYTYSGLILTIGILFIFLLVLQKKRYKQEIARLEQELCSYKDKLTDVQKTVAQKMELQERKLHIQPEGINEQHKELTSDEDITTSYNNSQLDEKFLTSLNKIVCDNIDNSSLDIPFVCKEIGMSRASLYNKLKALTGMSCNEYINKIRLERAVILVTTTTESFIEIADETGFANSKYFSTSFKQSTGMSPSQYRKKYCIKRVETEKTPSEE